MLQKNLKGTCYITGDHEWIRFTGSGAYVGVCDFKLVGLTDIQEVEFRDFPALVNQGSLLARIVFGDYIISVHMPLDGWIVAYNLALLHNPTLVLRDARGKGWISIVKPLEPISIKGLRADNFNSKQQQ